MGNFYFGGIDGLVKFNPLKHIPHAQKPKLYFTRLLIDGKEVAGSTDILFKDKITLPHDSANIVLEMASPDFVSMGNKHYKYKLEPVDKEWIEVNMQGNVPSISYANLQLAPTRYMFWLKQRSNQRTSNRNSDPCALV